MNLTEKLLYKRQTKIEPIFLQQETLLMMLLLDRPASKNPYSNKQHFLLSKVSSKDIMELFSPTDRLVPARLLPCKEWQIMMTPTILNYEE